MQVKRNDGSYGETMPFTKDNMEKALSEKDTKHVEVFEGTPEELERRKKTQNFFKVKKKGFNKKGK